MKKLILFSLAFGMFGCATNSPPERSYDQKINDFVGKPIADLIMKFGAPSGSIEISGSKFITYEVKSGHAVVPIGFMVASVPRECKTTFEVGKDDIVRKASYEGNFCRL